MKYIKFLVENYKGLEGPLSLDISKNPLIPIIGVNECGKTSILQAIFSFDFINDSFNKNVRHLDDVFNRYTSTPHTPKITATIEISKKDINDMFTEMVEENTILDKTKLSSYKASFTEKKGFHGEITITRNLDTKKYIVKPEIKDREISDEFCRMVIRHLPYILFFDDFRDSIDNTIEIQANNKGEPDGWLAILDRLFKATDSSYSVLDLPKKEERDRKGILSNVNRKLEKVLTTHWRNFRLEDRKDALKIRLDYEKETDPENIGAVRHYLKFDVVEQDEEGQEYFFFIQDRSKGFYWFFNFVMKLEFNPKIIPGSDNQSSSIYLLDEPGSYLHANAQIKLCEKIKTLSEDNKIIYCTHSHYLLNPEVIPINSIKVAVKDPKTFKSALKSIHEYEGEIVDQKSAFQPILDALQIKPFGLDMKHEKIIVIVEGIYDYYSFMLFKDNKEMGFLPSRNADSVSYFISLMIGWGINYRALWDGDKEGETNYIKACNYFGETEAKRFLTLPKNKILQNLYEGVDLTMIRQELGINLKSSFEKTILSLFFSKERDRILKMISTKTKKNFEDVFNRIKESS